MRLLKTIVLLFLFWLPSAQAAVPVERLKTHISWLADPARQGRRSGSPGAVASAEYIASQFREAGYTAQMQEFGGNRRNVVARWGTAENYLVIGAHYDGQGPGHPSASDNACGAALVIELARALKDARLPLSIVAIAFDDEEQGLNGSRYYADHPLFPMDKAVAALIFDTLGRTFMDLSSPTLFVLGTEYSSELAEVVQKHSDPDMLIAGTDLIGPRSDFAAFALKHIPYLFFTDGTNKDYHGEGDVPSRLDFAHLAEESSRIEQIALDLGRLSSRPKFLAEPVYPAAETAALAREFAAVEKERPDLPAAYRLIFADLQKRIQTDHSREIPQMAASAFLALATPDVSAFLLTYYLGPYYEGEKRRDIVIAIDEEAIKWSEGTARRQLEDRVRVLKSLP